MNIGRIGIEEGRVLERRGRGDKIRREENGWVGRRIDQKE
jgi:hypothetical protein